MPRKAVITFDLKSQTSNDYKIAYDILGNANFQVVSPNMGILLPNTTVMGFIPDHWGAADLRDAVMDTFRNNGLNLTSILCGIVSDWAVWGDRADYKSFAA
ncbi:hypothetical protein VZQ01_35920 [Myxococcus faecalis]|uniref:hypothetical protein n=1 Tax=Myxococcus faecalis TaxID=3115646 RepID=UPI003CF32666